MSVFVALDFGGTKIACGVKMSDEESWREIRRFATPPDAQSSLRAAIAEARGLLEDHSATSVDGIGVSFGGHVDHTSGIVTKSMQIPGWEGIPLARLLEENLGAPATVANDATAGALGEWRHGAGRGLDDVVYLTVSTGVGGGLILDGRPYLGASGLAAEFGHLPVPGADQVCTCGSTGCLEAVAAGPAIATAYARASHRVATNAPPLTAETIAERANAAGDPIAEAVITRAGSAVGLVASQIVTSFDPQVVVIGGGVAKAGRVFWTALKAAFREPLQEQRWVKVARAEHLDQAPLYGALHLASQAHRNGVIA